jgi:hypothetical protein
MDRSAELNEARRRGKAAVALLVLAALAIALAVVGCSKKDGGGRSLLGNGGPPPYSEPTSPQNVLFNMIASYEARDSVQTAQVYDAAYQGASTDFSSPSPTTLTFTKFDEVHHVGFLRLDPNITSVALDFGPQSTWSRLPPDVSDPADWAVLQINNAQIQIQDINMGTTSQAQNNMMLYTFIPTVAAPGDTTWKIVRWTEVKN